MGRKKFRNSYGKMTFVPPIATNFFTASNDCVRFPRAFKQKRASNFRQRNKLPNAVKISRVLRGGLDASVEKLFKLCWQ